MSLATAMTAIGAHLTAAGAAVTPQIIDVARGAPASVPAPLIRYWYAGVFDKGKTISTQMIGRRVNISAFWPISDKAVLANLDERIAALQDEIFTRILGDSQLGGACDDLAMAEADVDYPIVNGAQVAELTIPLSLDFLEAYTISA